VDNRFVRAWGGVSLTVESRGLSLRQIQSITTMKTLTTFISVTALVALSAAQASAMVAEPCHVPDTASTAALLGAGILGLFGVRRFFAKR
jgi:hypothetical protein